MDKYVVYIKPIHNRILFSNKKNEILPFTTIQTDLEDPMLYEISQTETNTI